jgi:hypothetical protein
VIIKPFTFKSQGDLSVCVEEFRKWYANRGLDLTSRHVEQIDVVRQMQDDPWRDLSTVLIGHSMGGIIAMDAFLAMSSSSDPLLPSILGIIAYDTPYLGLNPPVFQRTISTRVDTISSTVSSAREWVPQSFFSSPSQQVVPPAPVKKSRWATLGKYVAVGASVAAVGAMTYLAKDTITNHLQFVSALGKPETLSARVKQFMGTKDKTGFACFYTVVGVGKEERTFCLLPNGEGEGWIRQVNGLARDEVEAHCGMFELRSNDGYEEMRSRSLALIQEWANRK